MNKDWGVRPILFEVNNFKIESYPFFVGLGILLAIIFYIKLAKKEKKFRFRNIDIILASIVGGAIGSKLPIIIMNYDVFFKRPFDYRVLFYGKTIVGGIIGGIIAVYLVKKKLKIKQRIGNELAPAIALGMGIGRLGCFFRGCCYGIETHSHYGVDFGDGLHRHPTQLYESIFNIIMFVILLSLRKKVKEEGKLLKIFFTSYFIFRFLIEFIRIEEKIFYILTAYQVGSLFAILLVNREYFINKIRREKGKAYE